MPNTRYFSNPEKRRAMNLLAIHDDITAVRLLAGINQRTLPRWRRNLPGRQIATLSEKSFSLSDKRTMSAKPLTNHKLLGNLALTPDPSIQPPTDPKAARKDSHNANEDGSSESPGMEFRICPVSLKFTTPNLYVLCALCGDIIRVTMRPSIP